LIQRSKGLFKEEKVAREEGHRRRVEELRRGLEGEKGKQGEKERGLMEGLREGGFMTEAVG
jgi:hypothetical protein